MRLDSRPSSVEVSREPVKYFRYSLKDSCMTASYVSVSSAPGSFSDYSVDNCIKNGINTHISPTSVSRSSSSDSVVNSVSSVVDFLETPEISSSSDLNS